MAQLKQHNSIDQVLELLTEQGTEGLAEALRILLNAAMLFERERFLVAAPFKQWRERLLGRWFICSWMPAMRKSARAA